MAAHLASDIRVFWKLACFLSIFWMPASLILCAVVYGPLMLLSDFCLDVEDVGIQVADASVEGGGQSYLLLNGSSISESLAEMANTTGFNFTGHVDDFVIPSISLAMEHYLKGAMRRVRICTTMHAQFQRKKWLHAPLGAATSH